MKYLKKFQTNSDYQAFKGSSDWITPNLSAIEHNDTVFYEKFTPPILTFTINGTEYQAEEGMTFYDWAMSDYFNTSCPLNMTMLSYPNLRDCIIGEGISASDSVHIGYGAGGASVTPNIFTDTIIQPISYMPDFSGFDGQ